MNAEGRRQLSSKDERDILLRDLNLRIRHESPSGIVRTSMEMPHRTHIESACKVVVENIHFSNLTLHYYSGPAESYPDYFRYL